jgi:hypothetical protein
LQPASGCATRLPHAVQAASYFSRARARLSRLQTPLTPSIL